MKRIERSRSKRGETLVEILVAVLIIALSAGLFASMYSASLNINLSAREQDEKFYQAVSELEEMAESEDTEVTAGQVHYESTGENKNSAYDNDVDVDVLTQDGMSVYKDKDDEGGGA